LQRAAEPVIIVASSEFTLKSSPVRRTLEQRLIDDLRFSLSNQGEESSRVERDAARLVIHGVRQTAASALTCSRVFGVAYAAPAFLVHASMKEVTRILVNLALEGLSEGGSFAIRAHRSTPGKLSRREVELSGGTEVLRALSDRGGRVDLDQPDLTLYVDLVGDWAYVYKEKMEGPGGLPLSSQWKMLAVLDSGPLTILAAYAMMRRGCMVQLFIPTSHTVRSLAAETQLTLAKKLAQLVARPGYKAFTLNLDQLLGEGKSVTSLGGWKQLARAAAIKFAKKKRFRGVILADIEGRLEAAIPYRYSEVELPIIHPLLGLERADIDQLSRLVGLEAEVAQGESSIEGRQIEGDYLDSSDLPQLVHEISF
jgi:thiamine biosynthesis protein ThiI